MKHLHVTANAGLFLICSTLSVYAQEVYPSQPGNEQVIMHVNPESGASSSGPGRDLMESTMPSGPQTELNFPESPEPNESNTTVIIDGGDGGDSE